MGEKHFWTSFWVLAVAIAALVSWFLGNLLYSLLWKELADHGFPISEAQMLAYIGAHLTPFLLALIAAALLGVLIRSQILNARVGLEGMRTVPSVATNQQIEIAFGEEEPFEKLTSAQLYRLERLLLLEFKNPYRDRAITNCKLEVISIEPFSGKRRPFILRENFDLAGGDHLFVPFVRYGESRNVSSGIVGDSGIAICAPEGANPNFLAALPIDVENIITVRATAMEASVCEERVVVWVGAGTRLRIRKFDTATDSGFIKLEDATKEAYGAARGNPVGLAAEKMNTNGVLAWFAFYYHTNQIPVYGNVRNSTKFEPVLFRHIDIKLENDRLIGKEVYGDLIWENMQVKKSDHAKLLAMLEEHAKSLGNG